MSKTVTQIDSSFRGEVFNILKKEQTHSKSYT